MIRAAFSSISLLLVSVPLMNAQNSIQRGFEVASVRRGSPYGPGVPRFTGPRPGGFVAQNTSLKRLVMFAFRMTEDQIVGGPSWMGQDGWNIEAKWPAGANQAQVPEMLQELLADRFHLAYRRETRLLPTYDLVVAKSGSKLRVSDATQTGGTAGSTALHYTGLTISQLVDRLGDILKRKVEDKTGLSGRYDLELSFAPVAPNPSVETASTEAPLPSIFAAIEQQLGLKLDATKAPTEVLVIDRAERATEN